MATTFTVYKVVNLITRKVYIGQTIQKPQYRWTSHKRDAARGRFPNSLFHNSIRKYGDANFEFTIVDQTATNSHELNEKEIAYIRQFDCCILDGADKGYNTSRGGEGIDATVSSKTQKSRVDAGTHAFSGANGKVLHAKKVANGTAPHLIERTCPHCAKTGSGGGMLVHHFEYCKANPNRIARARPVYQYKHHWEVTHVDWNGKWIVVDVLKEFCRANSLSPSVMTLVDAGKQEWHRGYKCRRIASSTN